MGQGLFEVDGGIWLEKLTKEFLKVFEGFFNRK